MVKHQLTFRGQDYAIPAGYGRCTRCGALLQIEEWLADECPGQPQPKEERDANPEV